MLWQKSENAYMISAFIDIAVNHPEALATCFAKENHDDNLIQISLQIDGQERTFDIDTFLPIRPGTDKYSFNLIWM